MKPEVRKSMKCWQKKGFDSKRSPPGIHFRRFLHKLTEHNLLKLIPQCKNKRISDKQMEWFFYPISIDSQNINHVPKPDDSIREVIYVHVPKMSEEEMNNRIGLLRPLVDQFPKRTFSNLDPATEFSRKHYARSSEYWSKEEDDLLNSAFEEFGNVNKVAQLLLRQPNSVELRLKKCGIIK
ncbi:MAG: hypothetical protein IPG90_18735 [Bacteroidetes bacterium]|nr:hypothetical protein [Bacteroidota bacterium]